MSRIHDTTRSLFLTGIAAGLGALLVAAPASAGDAFERGYHDEMGRIAAHATVGFGAHLLHAAFAPVHVLHAVTFGHPEPRHYRHGPRHGPRHGHYKKHHEHRRHAWSHGDHRGHKYGKHRGYDRHDDRRGHRGHRGHRGGRH